MTFNAGDMLICEGCGYERLRDGGEVFYCALGEKIDSSVCARWQNNLVAQETANLMGQAIDRLPDGGYRTSAHNGVQLEDDDLYEKCRLIERVQDALADYFNESWSHDAEMRVSLPSGVGA